MNNIKLADIFFALCNTRFNKVSTSSTYLRTALIPHTSADRFASIIVTTDRDGVLAAFPS